MPLDFSRIAPIIDVERMQASHVTVVGNGGGANLCRNLVRCGLGHISLVDFDHVEAVNICRQEHMADVVGMQKVHALAAELRRINPDLRIEPHARDFCSFSDEEIDRHFGRTDLFVFAVDNLKANARGNEVALRLRKAAVWSGVYARGAGGEVAFWHPHRPLPCFRCLCAARYRSHERGAVMNQPAESADVLSVQFVDSIAGMIAVGLLTRGAPTFYGRLIEELADRNFLHVKVHDWTWRGRDVVREQLRIPADCDAFCAWSTAARRDPDGGKPPCPDCVRFLSRLPTARPASAANGTGG
jgi:hypothetical protein